MLSANFPTVFAIRLLMLAIGALVLKTTASVVLGYVDYLPPNFDADFLLGREAYFWGAYGIAFYVHLLAGPLSLVLTLLLVSTTLRCHFPTWHRWLGRVQVANILLLLTPSGLWMSWYAATGTIAAVGLALLAIATALCTIIGWRFAIRRQFLEHQHWMQRTYLLLLSAVVIRILGGLATVWEFNATWIYPASVWISWLVPLVIFELWRWHRAGRVQPSAVT
ncbi:hypothetical protein Psta_0230 [Pirellula staleyi DSM 6068]|uniref:DUF2306 domain-containing protein n=1 Tax=Pirellula staleyi (strain ATCC 27377 / DSM 6068 / ICPB 4128) TaxID=530564 RepID=D2R1E1_PIRSD|nr:hypothetical protein Psta_0230 [Pirellula staleyi DSM 6068]